MPRLLSLPWCDKLWPNGITFGDPRNNNYPAPFSIPYFVSLPVGRPRDPSRVGKTNNEVAAQSTQRLPSLSKSDGKRPSNNVPRLGISFRVT